MSSMEREFNCLLNPEVLQEYRRCAQAKSEAILTVKIVKELYDPFKDHQKLYWLMTLDIVFSLLNNTEDNFLFRVM